MRRSLNFIVALALACAGSQKTAEAPPASQPAVAAGKDGRKLMIVGINDTHGALLSIPPPKWAGGVTKSDIGGAEWCAGWMDAIRADAREHGGEVVILDAGDEFQGTLISNEFRGKSVVDAYNAAGVSASAL